MTSQARLEIGVKRPLRLPGLVWNEKRELVIP